MSKNPNPKSNDDNDDNDKYKDNDDDVNNEILRGGLAREETHKACDENSFGEKNTPTISMVVHHLVHLNSYLEVYIVRHTHRAGKKKHDQC